MKKTFTNLFVAALFLFCSNLWGQNTPSGNSFLIDYVSWNAGTSKPPVYIDCGNANSFNTGFELTMEVWIRIYDAAWNQKIMGKATNTFDNGYVQAIEAGQNYSEIWNPNKNQIKEGSIPQDSAWVHLATVFSAGDKMTGYVNGVKVQEVTVPANQIGSNSSSFIIGNAPWDLVSLQTFGYIDEIRVWSVARSEDEIKSYMFKHLKGNENGLIAYYDFNQADGITLNDKTANGNNGTIYGSPYCSFVTSYAAVADDSMYNMQDVNAIWFGKDPTQFNYAVTSNGLSLIGNIGDKAFDYAVFGHNGDTGVTTSGVPAIASPDFKRLSRVWYFSEGGNVGAKMYFNLVNAAGGGTVLPSFALPKYYTLLVSDSADGHFEPVFAANSVNSGVVKFDNFVPIENKYYTIGVGSTQIASGVGIEECSSLPDVTIYPNPANDYVTFGGVKDADISIYDLTGKKVASFHSGTDNASISTEMTGSGVFIVKITKSEGSAAKRLIIQ